MADTVICGGAYEALVATEDEATVHVEACAEEETRPDGLEETPFHGTTFAVVAKEDEIALDDDTACELEATVQLVAWALEETRPEGLELTLAQVTAFAVLDVVANEDETATEEEATVQVEA